MRRNPVAKTFNVVGNKYIDPGDANFPIVVTTYRLTEHHLSGVMSRWVPWLAELQPELFIELSPELAKERGIENTGWVTVSTPRGAIECKALVTRRLRPFQVNGRLVHQAGMPWHWGYRGVVTGAVVNTLVPLVGDPNVTIHEGKAFMCQVEAGRKSSDVLARLADPATPLPRVGRRERQAAEAAVDYGIAVASAAGSLDELVVWTGERGAGSVERGARSGSDQANATSSAPRSQPGVPPQHQHHTDRSDEHHRVAAAGTESAPSDASPAEPSLADDLRSSGGTESHAPHYRNPNGVYHA
jgi:hypothetical protein